MKAAGAGDLGRRVSSSLAVVAGPDKHVFMSRARRSLNLFIEPSVIHLLGRIITVFIY